MAFRKGTCRALARRNGRRFGACDPAHLFVPQLGQQRLIGSLHCVRHWRVCRTKGGARGVRKRSDVHAEPREHPAAACCARTQPLRDPARAGKARGSSTGPARVAQWWGRDAAGSGGSSRRSRARRHAQQRTTAALLPCSSGTRAGALHRRRRPPRVLLSSPAPRWAENILPPQRWEGCPPPPPRCARGALLSCWRLARRTAAPTWR